MKIQQIRNVLLPLVMVFAAASANATVVTVFNAPAVGLANFDSTVKGAGATPISDNWTTLASGTSIARKDYTLTRNNGGSISPTTYGTLSGKVVDISPRGGAGALSISSGVTLSFSQGINSIGFEVGDWGTCCQPSKLFISFDDGAAIQVGSSTVRGDAAFGGKYEVFVAAFDDTNAFTKVHFWGDGAGEFLVFGGTIHYALLGVDSLPPSGVPEPASLGLLGLGMLGVVAARRRKSKAA